jgi:hypothetical protein
MANPKSDRWWHDLDGFVVAAIVVGLCVLLLLTPSQCGVRVQIDDAANKQGGSREQAE